MEAQGTRPIYQCRLAGHRRVEPLPLGRQPSIIAVRTMAQIMVAEARIELACAAYETALEPLQVLRNKLAVAAGFEPAMT